MGAVTVTYVATRGCYEGVDTYEESHKLNERNLELGEELKTLSKYEIEERDLGYFDVLRKSILKLDSFIEGKLSECIINYNDGYHELKAQVKRVKQDLSEKRCDYISYTFLAPRFKYALMYAELYNEQWRIWGIIKRDETLIDNAFDAIGNHGDLIMSSREDCRNAFIKQVIPALKKKLSKTDYEDKIAMTGYKADGSTGPRLWLDWME